ncbi:hypothetical protein Emed_005057 [Eimeria media]
MQPPAQAGMPPSYRGPQDMAGGGSSARGPGGPAQRPMQQRPGGPPGMAGQMNAPQRPGPPGGQMGGAPPPGQSGGRPMGGMPGAPGGQQGPRPGMGSPGMGPRGPPGGAPGRPMGGPPGGPMGGGPPGGQMGGPMGGLPRGPMGGPAGGPMGGPPGGQMGGGPPGGQMGGGPQGGPMGGPGGMRFGGPPGGRPPMQGPGGAGGMPMRPPPGQQMGGRPMQMMRSQSGQFAGPQRPAGGGGGTGGPPDMRGPMQGPPMPGYGQPGRPDTGSMPGAQMQRQPSPPRKPAQATAQKVAVIRPPRKTRGQVGGGDTDKELDEDLALKGGLGTFKNLVVLNDSGDLGSWTGFQWKGRREGRIWCINENWEVGRLTNSSFKSLGLLGNEYLVDIAFNPTDSSLWAVNRIGELLRWSGFSLERKAQHGFHKLKAITFDRKGNLWALNTACELAVWNKQDEEWDVKDVPGAVRMTDLAFDERNRLWIIGPEGQLMLLSGSKWVNYGFVGCWKMTDISFKVSKLPASPAPETKAE